jgi:hypothetical protein
MSSARKGARTKRRDDDDSDDESVIKFTKRERNDSPVQKIKKKTTTKSRSSSSKSKDKDKKKSTSKKTVESLPNKTPQEIKDIERRSQELAINNAWWEARREASKNWGGDSRDGARRCLIIGGLQCGAINVIKQLVTECAKGTPDAHLKGLIISPHERMDPELRSRYPAMRWCKFFGQEALNLWRALNARAEPFYVLVSGGILGMHIDDELLEIMDNNKGTLILHQTGTNMLDSVFTFDRILANADRKVLYPLCQDFVQNMAAWDKYAEALLQDSKLFIDIIKGVNNASLFKIKN